MFVHNSIQKHISFKCYNLIQSNIHNTIKKNKFSNGAKNNRN